MEGSGRNSCFYQGKVYSDGSDLCGEKKVYCMTCNSGEWTDKDESFWDSFRSSRR